MAPWEQTASVDELKDYLAANGANQEDYDTEDIVDLRHRVRRKRRRLMMEATENAGVQNGIHSALSLDAYKSLLVTINNDGYGPKSFVSVKAKLVCIEGKHVVLRHQEGEGACRHVIVNGRCDACNVPALGVWAFSMTLVLEDLEDAEVRLDIPAYKAIAAKIFGTTDAAVVAERSRTSLLDTMEEWFETPVKIDLIVEYDAAKGRARANPYNMTRLPLDYMPERE